MRVVSPPHPIQTIPVPRRCPDRRCWKRSRCASPTSLSRCLGSPPPRVDRGPLHYPPCHDEKKREREKKIVHYFFILKINDREARRRIRVLLLEQSWWILCVHQSSPFRPVYYLLAIEQKEWEKKYCHGIQDKIDLLVITLKNCTMRKAQQGTRSAKRFYSLQWFFLSLSSSRYYTENQSARPAERDTKREKGSLFTWTIRIRRRRSDRRNPTAPPARRRRARLST